MSSVHEKDVMDQVIETLSSWDAAERTLDAAGGEGALYAAGDRIRAERLEGAVVELLVGNWGQLKDRGVAANFIASMIRGADAWNLEEALDLVLGSPDVLGEIHEQLLAAIREVADGDDAVADFATEGWVRLALGGWCPRIPVLGHLYNHATALQLQPRATAGVVVRTVGAAASQWPARELRNLLKALKNVEGVEDDVAFELGMLHLGAALQAKRLDNVVQRLRKAHTWLASSAAAGERLDATLFSTTVNLLIRYAEGGDVSTDDADRVHRLASNYLLGYRGLARHWRQGRADTAAGWSTLISQLAAVRGLELGGWYEPAKMISAAIDVYVAQNTLELVTKPDGSTANSPGISALVRPRLVQGYGAAAAPISFLDTWARDQPECVDTSGVDELRRDLLAAAPTGDAALDEGQHVAQALHAAGVQGGLAGELVAVFGAAHRPIDLAVLNITSRTRDEINAVTPVAQFELELRALLLGIVSFASFSLDEVQQTARSPVWLKVKPGDDPHEHPLADELRKWLLARSLQVVTEVANVGGGRADLRVSFPRVTFHIEVKRMGADRTNEQLANQFGDQAVQYQATGAPVALLAVLDYHRRKTRIDLPNSIWTQKFQPNAASRTYSLTGIRVQTAVESPSAASKTVGASYIL